MAAIVANRPLTGLGAAATVVAILAAATAATLSVIAPLAVYSLTLAAFGLPHVLSELRYVDRRFGRSLDLMDRRRHGYVAAGRQAPPGRPASCTWRCVGGGRSAAGARPGRHRLALDRRARR